MCPSVFGLMRRASSSMAALVATTLCAAGGVQAATVTFHDGAFVDAAWGATKIIDTTAGASATFAAEQVTSGGNADEYRKVTHVFDFGSIYVGHLSTASTYDPSVSGAVLSLAYSYDLMHIDPPPAQAVAYGIVIHQNDSWYSPALDNIFPQTWTAFGQSGLTAASFVLRAGSGPASPDFTGSGGLMTFGYLSANGNSGGVPDLVRISGIDNWQVELTTVPLPSGVWLLFSALSPVFMKLRRRSS